MDRASILIVTEAFHPAVDAATTTARHLADHLIATGADVQLMALSPGLEVYRSSRVVRLRPLEPIGPQVRGVLQAQRPDLVIALSPRALGRKALKHAGRLGIATATIEHARADQITLDSWRLKVAERSDALLTVSHAQACAVAGLGPVVWHPGVDVETFTPARRDAALHDRWARSSHPGGRRLVVGFVGDLARGHRVRQLLAVADVPGTELVVVGEGRQREWLRERLPRAQFLPVLASGDLAVAMASFDALVHPSAQLTSAHALRAAAAAGVPVVAADAGGAAEAVRHLETGLLFESETPDAFGDEITALLDADLAALGARGRELAGRRTWQHACAELTERHLTPLLGRPLAA
ncbi:glycosyltransferase [Nocardioides dubius]|uniref:Glycosyltransferase family 1 protein n=1 Tax=Nocardioides dubius TaxID=317019 RepID=A0ABP4E788_9ACTN